MLAVGAQAIEPGLRRQLLIGHMALGFLSVRSERC
jgi:hypothetical protein